MGLMFRSKKGIYLLDRTLALSYIGAPVEGYNTYSISAAVLLASQNLVVFTTSDGPALVYDYSVGQWCTWDNHTAVDALEHDDGATSYGPRLYHVTSAGVVRAMTPGGYYDDDTVPSLSFTTAWYQLGGQNGYQRLYHLYLLGTFVDATTITVSLGYDFDASFGTPATFAAASPFQYRIDPARQRCTAVRVKVVDAPTVTQGYAISALSAEIGVLPGGVRLPAGQIKATT